MNCATSPSGVNNGSGSSTDFALARRSNNGNEPIHTTWCGIDVVLTDNCHPSESKKSGHNDELTPPKHEAAHSEKFTRRESWRRTNSSLGDDYGWLRKLDLRSDTPSINEIRDWSFDVLKFEETALIGVFIEMLEYYDFFEKFQLDKKTLERYCQEVMDRHQKDCYYQKLDIQREGVVEERKADVLCEYHNWYHAVSCSHVSFLFLTLGGADAFLSPLERFCIIMGALIHDLHHPGTNNDFEVKRSTPLAKRYGNDAVLERHAINMGLNMCQENPDLDWLNSFDQDDREYVKHFLSESVLATDPARHADIVNEALSFVENGLKDYQTNSNPDVSESDYEPSSSMTHFNSDDPTHRLFLGKLILHSADISNPLHVSFEVASDWAIRVITEFSRQAEKEKQLQLPVTTFMDGLDSQVKIAKVQIGFFRFMVKPLYHTIGILFSNLAVLEEWGEKNCVRYQMIIDEQDKKQHDSNTGEP